MRRAFFIVGPTATGKSELAADVAHEIGAEIVSADAFQIYRGLDLISDALPFGRLWYGEPNAISNAIDYAKHRRRSHDAVIRVYDAAGNVIETHEHKGE